MNMLPKSWRQSTVGSECETTKGKKPLNSGEYSDKRTVPYINIKAFESGLSEQFAEPGDYPTCKQDDVLIVWDGARAGLIGRGVSGYIGSTLAKISADCVKNSFLSYFLQSKYADINSRTKGVGIPHVNPQVLNLIKLPIPPPMEQTRIVAEIEKQFTRLEAGVAALKRMEANLKRYRASVLKAACEGKLVSADTNTWESTIIGKHAEIITKGSSPNWQGFEYSENGIMFVRSQNVSWGKLDLTDVARLPAAFNRKEKKSVLKAGDVLLNIVGASIGRAAVATLDVEGGNVNQAVAVIRPLKETLLAQFLVYYLLSEKAQAFIHAQKVDVARANFSLEQVRNLPVKLPNISDQIKIIAEVERRLSVVEELETAVKLNLERATRLRQAILQKAFTGELC